jgi:uncharacterized protein (TIGR03435 family)
MTLRPSICVALALVACLAQTPQFEAASIHLTDPKDFSSPSGCPTTTGLLRCTNVTLKRCIVGAYGVGPDRVVGGPDWIDTDRFEITARSDQPVGDKGLMALLQMLLAERFKLSLHTELRRGEAMVLDVSKKGSKLQSVGDAGASWKNMHDHLDATQITMSEFAEILSRNLNLPVVDRTGLSGAFTFALRWNPEVGDNMQRHDVAAALRAEISAAVERQLGLTLKSRTMPVETLVIDHAEKPSEN